MSNTKNNKSIIYNKRHTERGVVLFVALTVSSLVLVIGIGILNVMSKEMILGSLSTKSREAFYAADSGIECAMHWDLVEIIDDKHGVAGTYSTSTFPVYPEAVIERNTLNIDGVPISNAKFNPFCAGQTADNIFDGYLQTYFGIAEPASYTAGVATTQFVFFPEEPLDLNNPDITKPCVLVTVKKEIIVGVPQKIQTEISSEGFSSCNSNDQRRVSRGVMVQYEI